MSEEIPVFAVGADGDVSIGDAYLDDTDALVVHFAPVGVCGTIILEVLRSLEKVLPPRSSEHVFFCQ